ncbi:T-cell surface antigen CD2 isoform X2 [Triplophysa dalaica]|nr:T-cell surface antigen CD2 isoform X2 [Triplophysa dalaica]
MKFPDNIKAIIKPNEGELKWTFNSLVAQRKKGKNGKTFPDATIESDGSLKLQNVKVSNTGTYKFEAYDNEDKVVANHNVEIAVYEKALKPNVTHKCMNGNFTLTCDTKKNDQRDLTITWYNGPGDIKGENKAVLFQTSQQLQKNTEYSCRVGNPASDARSDVLKVSCADKPWTLFGFDFWIMVGILSGGGALLLLLICVLVICAFRSCEQREKEKDEEELRLRSFDTPTNQQRAKVTARGQPAPPIPQEDYDPATQTPPQTQSQTKGPVRARPPPPPNDEDEENPPPLPRPRKKREKRAEEPYRPME